MRWVDNFAERHGSFDPERGPEGLMLRAADGATALLMPPPGAPVPGSMRELVAEVLAKRRVGLLLARKANVAVGVADGAELLTSKVDSSYVQSRTAAGGWSQHRYARRRDNQAKAAAGDAADLAVRLLLPAAAPAAGGLAAVVTGGDRRTVDTILADPRLAALVPLVSPRFLDVPDPKLDVLKVAATRARAVEIVVRDPTAPAGR